ncbi:hypothetical protein SAMN05444141_106112 [Pseudovibrio denitrificans]|uniref:Uncharacterized protein n=1 Tax=Pseudovibrio denitrificans TaxID=258256 RepID=A0A1I7CLE9_9HYPH|nr:hypothetical protein SAMN05444141_106112 [Pseudovibrio denitrificans]
MRLLLVADKFLNQSIFTLWSEGKVRVLRSEDIWEIEVSLLNWLSIQKSNWILLAATKS